MSGRGTRPSCEPSQTRRCPVRRGCCSARSCAAGSGPSGNHSPAAALGVKMAPSPEALFFESFFFPPFCSPSLPRLTSAAPHLPSLPQSRSLPRTRLTASQRCAPSWGCALPSWRLATRCVGGRGQGGMRARRLMLRAARLGSRVWGAGSGPAPLAAAACLAPLPCAVHARRSSSPTPTDAHATPCRLPRSC